MILNKDWHEDQSIYADNISVGLARDGESLDELGVIIALSVTISGRSYPFQMSAVMPSDQAVQVADSIHAAVRDIELAG